MKKFILLLGFIISCSTMSYCQSGGVSYIPFMPTSSQFNIPVNIPDPLTYSEPTRIIIQSESPKPSNSATPSHTITSIYNEQGVLYAKVNIPLVIKENSIEIGLNIFKLKKLLIQDRKNTSYVMGYEATLGNENIILCLEKDTATGYPISILVEYEDESKFIYRDINHQ